MKRTIILVLVLLGIVVVTVGAQSVVVQQQWEYVLMIADLGKSEFTFTYTQLNDVDYETTLDVWAQLEGIESAALIDYLGVMGLSGFELVSVEQLGGNFIYHFKRPL